MFYIRPYRDSDKALSLSHPFLPQTAFDKVQESLKRDAVPFFYPVIDEILTQSVQSDVAHFQATPL